MKSTCTACRGKGKRDAQFNRVRRCFVCHGTGRLTEVQVRERAAREVVKAEFDANFRFSEGTRGMFAFNHLRDTEPERFLILLTSVERGRIADVAAALLTYHAEAFSA